MKYKSIIRLFNGICLPKTFVGTMGQAEDEIGFEAGHMCSDIIAKQRCFRQIFRKLQNQRFNIFRLKNFREKSAQNLCIDDITL